MSASIKSLVVALIGLLLAVVIGAQVGTGEWRVAAIFSAAGLIIAIYLAAFRRVQIEALIVGFLIFGYIVANRGFAQLSLASNSPLYVGEVGLALCLALWGADRAVNRKSGKMSPLSWAVTAFLALGGLRLYFDIGLKVNHVPAITAIRDSAVVYYALFYFIGQRIASNDTSRLFVEKCVLVGSLLLLPIICLEAIFPTLMFRLTLRGFPLIAHKMDLATSYLGCASCYFFLKSGRTTGSFFFRSLSAVFVGVMLALTTRAALFGLAIASVLLVAARQSRFIVYQLVMALGILTLIGLSEAANIGHGSETFTSLADKIESMTDLSHSGKYGGASGEVSADNNQFRLVWWRSVTNETLRKGPVFGMGFGYDLASDFVREYFGNQQADFDTRSPHSIWVTLFGRMGFAGVACFAALSFLAVREAFRTARMVAISELPRERLGHWCAVIILLGSASFGVVLEGPMGGILFWSFLGFAASQPLKRRLPPDEVVRIRYLQPERGPQLVLPST